MFSFVSKMFRPFLVLIFTSLSIIWAAEGFAADSTPKAEDTMPYVELKEGADLVQDGDEAAEKQVPVLMFFSMNHCPFCIEVEEDYLKPMLRNSEYDNKVIIRKIRIDGTGVVRDFNGKEFDVEEFGDEYNVSMVPTLVLVDAKGKRLSPAIIGIANKHYYSGELDDAIDASIQKIRTVAKR